MHDGDVVLNPCPLCGHTVRIVECSLGTPYFNNGAMWRDVSAKIKCSCGLTYERKWTEIMRPSGVFEAFYGYEDITTAWNMRAPLESTTRQVSKALCGKENATAEEIIAAFDQVKRERDELETERHQLLTENKWLIEKNNEYEQSAINCCFESRCNKEIRELESLCGRLMDEKKQLERERDAAVNELIGTCQVCRWEETEKCASCHFNSDAWNVCESNWEWRGVKEAQQDV